MFHQCNREQDTEWITSKEKTLNSAPKDFMDFKQQFFTHICGYP